MPIIDNKYEIPALMITVTTYELMGDKWIATLSHSFHASDQDTLFRLIEAHRTTDSYFNASFNGFFPYKEGIIYLRNSDAKVVYP